MRGRGVLISLYAARIQVGQLGRPRWSRRRLTVTAVTVTIPTSDDHAFRVHRNDKPDLYRPNRVRRGIKPNICGTVGSHRADIRVASGSAPHHIQSSAALLENRRVGRGVPRKGPMWPPTLGRHELARRSKLYLAFEERKHAVRARDLRKRSTGRRQVGHGKPPSKGRAGAGAEARVVCVDLTRNAESVCPKLLLIGVGSDCMNGDEGAATPWAKEWGEERRSENPRVH